MTGDDEAATTDVPDDTNVRPLAIVGVGVCAVSLGSLRTLFGDMEPDLGAAFLIAVRQQDGLAVDTVIQAVAEVTDMPVVIASDGEPLQPGHVHVGGADDMITLADGHIHIRPAREPVGQRGTVDTLLISLAEQANEHAIAVILTGLGPDGAAGVVATKKFGGLSISEAVGRDGADAAGTNSPMAVTDLHVPAEQIAAEIGRYLRNLPTVAGAQTEREGDLDPYVGEVATILRNVTSHDFHGYKRGTFIRRIRRRMQVTQVDSLDAYVALLRSDREEVQSLFQDLLIGVTQFFRDPTEFETLEQELPALFERKGPEDAFRVWVLGCATGEEAYSLAILLREHMATMATPPEVQIFATDLDARALNIARAGRYSAGIADHIRPDRLERWFVREGDTFCVSKELREMCIFSPHNIVKDAPFSRIDILSCRNLLIYLDVDLQNRVIPIFHFSLRPGGVLFLGSSENVTRHQKLFAPISRRNRIFRRLETATRIVPDFPLSARTRSLGSPAIAAQAIQFDGRLSASVSRQADAIAERYAPAFIVVDPNGEVLHFSGRTGRYLEPSPGSATLSLGNLVHRDLRLDVRTAIQRAVAEGRRIEMPRLSFHLDDRVLGVNLVVEPLSGSESTALIVLFQDLGVVAEGDSRAGDRLSTDEHVQRLEAELRVTRDRLQATIEELESTNEELKSSNEEYQSINEELQSANEEMETSKEELQSVNEELQTVNSELAHRVQELGRINSDLKNLLESTQIATVFLDQELRVRNFTPAATDIFHLLETDVGRPLDHVVSLVDYPELHDDVRRVLKTLAPIDRQVAAAASGRHFAVRVLPYRSIDNYISGAVVTFTDLTAVYQAQEALRESEQRQQVLIEGVPQLVWRADDGGKWSWASPQWTSFTGQSEPESRGSGWLEVVHPDDRTLARTAWDGAEEQGGIDVEYRIRRVADGTYRWFRTRSTAVRNDHGEVVEWIGTSTDVDDMRSLQKRQEVLVAELQHRVRNMLTVVRSVFGRTTDAGGDLEDVAMHFRGRLDALARTQVIVTRTAQGVADLEDLIRDELLSVGAKDGPQVQISGPDVTLDAKTAESLGLAVHELTTNAVKYGALKVPSAVLKIMWDINLDKGGKRQLVLNWVETGVPAVPATPARSGFGRELIEEALPYRLGAQTELEFLPGGIRCTICVPLGDTEGGGSQPEN
ncbi:CheR family methyltransferase [Croceibacterium sp. TMG7-5b_MA50]|uniref:CheR family methyltransferase n=1 Tax=Croceibacterium sp. TMG7-5b_MA50 TaxID=3121290 RepID=UPI003221DD08